MTEREKQILNALEDLVSDATERLKTARARDAHWDHCNHLDTARSSFETALAAVREILEGT